MERYQSIYKDHQNLSTTFLTLLKEDLSFLNIWKYLDKDVMDIIEDLIKKFNAPRGKVCRELATLFDVLASEEEDKKSELEKSTNRNNL